MPVEVGVTPVAVVILVGVVQMVHPPSKSYPSQKAQNIVLELLHSIQPLLLQPPPQQQQREEEEEVEEEEVLINIPFRQVRPWGVVLKEPGER